MDDENGDREKDESEENWLIQPDWWRETWSLFQRYGDACRNERFVIFKEESVGWQASVTTEEVRVQRQG